MMMVEIALHTILAAMIGGIWLSVMVVAPAARNSLDNQSQGFYLKSFFFRLNLYIILLIVGYLAIIYFFQLGQYELIWSLNKNLIFLSLLGGNFINLLIGIFLNHEKNDDKTGSFRFFHSVSILILTTTSFVALYYLIEKFLEV